MKKQIVSLLCATTAVALLTSACGSSGGASGSDTKSGTLTVLAASSLTETFDTLAKTYEADHPGVKVKLVYDSSATLATMAEQGAPGDVLATADQKTMDEAQAKKGVRGTPAQFASNVVELAVPADNPGQISSFADLQKSTVKYVVCVKTAPCGAAGEKVLAGNKITHAPVSEEVDVKSVLAKVTGNEADAGLVYKTDVIAAGTAVTGFAVPGADASPNTYWVTVTHDAKRSPLAKAWIDLMQSGAGQAVFADAGFGKP